MKNDSFPRSLFVCLFSALLFMLCAFVAPVRAASLSVSWDYPAEVLPDVAEFRVFELVGNTWTLIKTAEAKPGVSAPLSVRVDGVTPAVRSYRVTAFHLFWQVESAPSNVAKTPPPGLAPGNMRVQRVADVPVVEAKPKGKRPPGLALSLDF